jgi:hypothetical protein
VFRQEKLDNDKRIASRFAREAKGLPVDDDPVSDFERIVEWLDLADQLYQTYLENNEWTPRDTKTNKAFNVTADVRSGKPPCYTCKKRGCTPATCSQPLNEEEIAKKKKCALPWKRNIGKGIQLPPSLSIPCSTHLMFCRTFTRFGTGLRCVRLASSPSVLNVVVY